MTPLSAEPWSGVREKVAGGRGAQQATGRTCDPNQLYKQMSAAPGADGLVRIYAHTTPLSAQIYVIRAGTDLRLVVDELDAVLLLAPPQHVLLHTTPHTHARARRLSRRPALGPLLPITLMILQLRPR